MCGFAGVIAWDNKYRTSPATLARMSAAIAHRGPDGEASYINHQDDITPDRPQVALAFRRLAILDPDPRSMQPFTDGRHWLVFNGEIYNFKELRKELSSLRPDYEWRTTGDTEVLLCAYAVWGEKCVEHLNGMFAFAVWDDVEKSLFLARDRMGQKPLYVTWNGVPRYPNGWESKPTSLAFASEPSALKKLEWFDSQFDSTSLTEYLQTGYTRSIRSIYKSVHRVAPRVCHVYSYERRSGRHYFEERSALDRVLPRNALVRELVGECVRKQMVSDVPIGCFLSGGVDSSVVAAGMKRAVGADQPLLTFSMGFDDLRYDESSYAASVAKHLGTKHVAFTMPPSAVEDLPLLIEAFGEPFADSSVLPTHYLASLTRPYVKVVLSGDGGDELFGGYDRYRAMLIAHRLPKAFRELAGLARLLPNGHPKSKLTKSKRFLSSLRQSAGHRYASYISIFSGAQIVELFPAAIGCYPNSLSDELDCILSESDEDALVPAVVAFDRLEYLPNDLLTKVDRCSMLHGLEVRSPFMDHELVQFAAGLTTDQLLKGGPKRMLREAFKDDLPAWVFKRKKMGFAVPIGDWFRGPLRAMLRDNLFAGDSFGKQHFNMKVVERLVDEHEQNRVDHSQRLYALLMLELWYRTTK